VIPKLAMFKDNWLVALNMFDLDQSLGR